MEGGGGYGAPVEEGGQEECADCRLGSESKDHSPAAAYGFDDISSLSTMMLRIVMLD